MELLWSPLSAHWIDLVLVLVLLEVVVVRVFLSKRWSAGALGGLIANLAAGAALILAVRLALVGAAGGWILLCLILSLVAHLVDVATRFREKLI